MHHALTKPLHKLAEPGGSVLPEGLKVLDLIDQAKMKPVTTLKLEHDPEKWGATTTTITDEWMRRIAGTGCVHADDLPGGRNDYLSQHDVVSQTQSEHNAALLVLCVLGLVGTGHHIDLFGPASNLPVGAAGLIMWGLVYIHMAPRGMTQQKGVPPAWRRRTQMPISTA